MKREIFGVWVQKSIKCSEQQQLSLNLTIVVSQEEIQNYCKNGCLEHTLGVLDCVHEVKRNFWFANDFNTWTLRSFLIGRCASLIGNLLHTNFYYHLFFLFNVFDTSLNHILLIHHLCPIYLDIFHRKHYNCRDLMTINCLTLLNTN